MWRQGHPAEVRHSSCLDTAAFFALPVPARLVAAVRHSLADSRAGAGGSRAADACPARNALGRVGSFWDCLLLCSHVAALLLKHFCSRGAHPTAWTARFALPAASASLRVHARLRTSRSSLRERRSRGSQGAAAVRASRGGSWPIECRQAAFECTSCLRALVNARLSRRSGSAAPPSGAPRLRTTTAPGAKNVSRRRAASKARLPIPAPRIGGKLSGL